MSDSPTTSPPAAPAAQALPHESDDPPEPEPRRTWEQIISRAWGQARAARYGMALAISLFTVCVSNLTFAPDVRFIAFAPTVILAALLGGFGPGLVATATCAVAVSFYWLEPTRSFRLAVTSDRLATGVFVLSGVLMSGLIELMHRMRHRAEEAQVRLRVALGSTQQARREAERLAAETKLLFHLAEETARCEAPSEVYEPALDGVRDLLGAERASILLLDADGVMRFKAWRGLSDSYRAAIEGDTPWVRDDGEPVPVVVTDVERDEAVARHRAILAAEGIRALALIPLVEQRRSIGQLVLGWSSPRTLSEHDRSLALTIASHVAQALARATAHDGLERSVRFYELFTGILAHDLRNPLGAVMGAAQLALAQNEGAKLVKPLSKILSSSQRMARMIDQLLDFTRMRLGDGLPIEPRPIDLLPILRQVADELDHAHTEGSVRFEHDGTAAGTWDPDRLAQVFSNLIGNALQHGDARQAVTVRLDGSAADAVRIEVHNMGSIPAAILPKVFNPLVSGEARRGGARGLGLGLFISRAIVESHGGTIDVRSDPAAGTTFAVVLPRTPGARPIRAGGASA